MSGASMPLNAPQLLARTSSASSVCSDDSLASGDTTLSLAPPDTIVDGPKRTRKRFTSLQLMMLEHLYHQASHPTRDQREQLARDAEIDLRSVTVWFQNKRQTDRRTNRQLSEPALVPLHLQTCSSPAPSTSLPPSSPFSDASGKTIHTVRERARTLSSASVSSLSSTSSRKREREREHEHDRRHVRHKPSRHLSLDTIAARSERPVLLPRTPPQCIALSSSPTRPRTPEPEPASEDSKLDEPERKALWENMQSSPAAPDPAPRSERDIIRYGRRRYTLEYACAKEMVGGKVRERGSGGKERKHAKRGKEAKASSLPTVGRRKAPDACTDGKVPQGGEEDDQEVPVLDWDVDVLGDTDTEGVPSEAVTPSSSFGIGELSVADDPEKENLTIKAKHTIAGVKDASAENVKGRERSAPDDDLMDVAYVLCGLSQRC